MDSTGTLRVLQTEESMTRQRTLSMIHDAGWKARDRYRWMYWAVAIGLLIALVAVMAIVVR